MRYIRLISAALSAAVCLGSFCISASALGMDTRKAGVLDNAADHGNAYSASNVKISGSMTASKTPGYVIYKLSEDITTAFISLGRGAEGVDFNILVSPDGAEYTPLKSLNKSKGFVMNSKSQRLLSFSGIAKGQHYFKVEFLTNEAKIYGVYVNVDPSYTIYKNIYSLAFKDNSGAAASGDLVADLKTYKKTMVAKSQSKADISSLLSSMSNDGSWGNISYTGRAADAAYEHLNRVTQILRAISTPANSYYKNEAAIEKVCKAIDYWANAGISFDNWFHAGVTAPQYIGEGLLVSQGVLPLRSEEKLLSLMKSRVNYIDAIEDEETGSNVPNLMKAKLYYALYLEDLQMVLDCFDRINMEMIMVEDMPETEAWRADAWRGYIKHSSLPSATEGIQADYSCLFHGPQIYSGGYGKTLLGLIAPMLADTNGTALFPQKGLQLLADHILEHYAYIMRGQTICYNTIGRQISTNSTFVKSGNGVQVFDVVEQLLKLENIPRRAELEAFLAASKAAGEKPYLAPTYPAASAKASAEPEAQSPATNVIDGNLTTRWAADGLGDEIIVDLGAECDVSTVAIAFYMGTARKTNFELWVSTDNANWSNVFEGQSSGLTDSYEYYVFSPRKVRYIKLVGYGNTSGAWNSINEISAFDTIPADTVGAYGESYKFIDESGSVRRYTLVEPEPVPVQAVTGHKFFWKTDFTGHAKDKFLFTIKSTSARTLGSEQINYENLKGEFQGNGSYYIYRTGKEYDDIFAAWDWHKLPGTTVETYDFTTHTEVDYSVLGSESKRVGGVSDGNNGTTAMELIRGSLSAKKAWFMFDDEVMALGTDIKLNKSKYSAITTINQSLLKSDVIVGTASGSTKTVDSSSPEKQSVSWVLQDKIGYVFGGNTKVNISAKSQTGDRYDIDWASATSRPDKQNMVTRDIFALWYDHTADKTNSYEYTIIPETTAEALADYAANNPLKVIANQSSLQAVKNTKTGECQAIFWKAGTEADFGEFKITADKEVIIAAKVTDGKLIISVASLEQKEDEVTLRVSGLDFADGKNEIKIEMPKGAYAGSTKTTELTIK